LNLEIYHEVEQFLYRESRLLDQWNFKEWLDLLTEDVRYWMPVRYSDYQGKRAMEKEHGPNALSFFDENKDTLKKRIFRRDNGNAYAEEPPSRTRHFISNIEVYEGDFEHEYNVFSNILVYRSRMEKDEDYYIGRREDVLRRENGKLKITSRKIVLEQNVLLVKNLSIFF